MANWDLDENQMRENVANFLNFHFGDDPKNVSKAAEVYRKLEISKKEAENKLSDNNTVHPNGLGVLKQQCTQVFHRADRLFSQKARILEDVRIHLNQNQSLISLFDDQVTRVNSVEKYICYLKWVQWLEEASCQVKTAIERGNDHQAVRHFESMVKRCEPVMESGCRNLVRFIVDTVVHWHRILMDRLSKNFESVLLDIKWPFAFTTVVGGGAPFLPTLSKDYRTRFETFFGYLLRVRLPAQLVTNHPTAESLPLPPLTLLLNPLKKRFVYHFCGHRKTNSTRKPEWYYTQILTWINSHGPFLERYAQPIADNCGINVDIEIEFMRGLVQMAVDKLRKDMPALILNVEDLSHVINETLMFERDLRAFDYPPDPPSCLEVLAQEDCFARWIELEENFAGANVDQMLSSPHAWDPQYSEKIEVDQMKIPECAESFLTMILTITERYKYLPVPGCRLRFLRLQLKLLDDLRMRLVQLLKADENDPLAEGSRFCAIFNAVNYVDTVLTDWCDLPLFLEMRCYQVQFESLMKEQRVLRNILEKARSSKGTSASSPLSEDKVLVKSELELFRFLRNDDDGTLDTLEGTVFQEILDQLGHMKTKMMNTLVRVVVTDVKAKSGPYRDERWSTFPPLSEVIKPSLTMTACPMLMVLKSSLNVLRRSLAVPLFNRLWQLVAKDLNVFVYQDVISGKKFSEGGAQQFNFDMTRNFFPIFAEHTQRPENFFKDVKEACVLLTLSKGSALLLVEALGTDPDRANTVLEELGVYKMNPKEVVTVLNLRNDLNIG